MAMIPEGTGAMLARYLAKAGHVAKSYPKVSSALGGAGAGALAGHLFGADDVDDETREDLEDPRGVDENEMLRKYMAMRGQMR